MRALFIANIDIGPNEGIYKKISAEADAIGSVLGECTLVTRRGKNAGIKNNGLDTAVCTDESFFSYILNEINVQKVEFIYIRHMVQNFKLISILRNARKSGIKIYYEIPTYPYFAEQFNAAKKKYRAIGKIGIDIVFLPIIYHYITRMVIIKSNTQVRMFRKMIEITNGVRVDNLESKNYQYKRNDNVFRMVTVGTLYPYHGYDRILKGLAACGERVGNTIVEFHVVGQSDTIDELHKEADSLRLKQVVFHGIKTTEELNELYNQFDIGLGCLALFRRNADVDTTLKVIEYFCRGIPVISSGKCPLQGTEFTMQIPNDDTPVDIESIYNYYLQLSFEMITELSDIAKEKFSWSNIMLNCLDEVIKERRLP